MRLAYKAFNKAGREFTDVIEAPTQAEASQKLRDQDLYVAQIGPADQAPGTPASTPRRRGGKIAERWPSSPASCTPLSNPEPRSPRA